MTDPATRARLTALQDQLSRPTPPPVEGQESIPVDEQDGDEPGTATQPALW